MKKITITELAKTASVSATSVKRFLNNEKVRADIERKIKEALEKLECAIEDIGVETKEVVEDVKEIIEEKTKDKTSAKEDFSKKLKGAVKKTGEMMEGTKAKLASSGESIKKNVSKADIPGKLKGSIEKSSATLSKVKDKISTGTHAKTSKKATELPLKTEKVVEKKKLPRAPKVKEPIIREKKDYVFGILTKDVTNPRSRKMIKAIQEVSHESHCLFSVYVGEGNAPLEERYVEAMIKQQVHAVIIESCANPSSLAKQLKEANIVCVFLNQRKSDITSLAVNEVEAGEVLGEYLMKMRHLVVRYLGADETLSSEHYEGIKKVYHEKKQPLDFATRMCDGSYLDIYEKLKEVFEEKIDVLLLERDEMAIPLNKYLKEYHIAVPQNTSVMSFGGHAITRVMSPTLTSLAFDYNAYAEYVCATIFAIIEGKTKPKMPEIYRIQEGDSVR